MPTNTSSHKDLVARLLNCWNTGKCDKLDELVTRDFARYGPEMEGKVQGASGLRELIMNFRKLLPDLHTEATDIIEQGDRIILHFQATATLDGKRITREGVNLLRLQGDKVSEDRSFYDTSQLEGRMGQRRAVA
jgi:ketosteroid isomerase-like protein